MATKTIDIHEAQQRLMEVLAQVAAGTEVIFMDAPTPRARLVPVAPVTTRRVLGLHTGSITISADFDTPLPDDSDRYDVKVLLDTHTFIWWDSDPTKLSATALALLTDPTTEVMGYLACRNTRVIPFAWAFSRTIGRALSY